MKSASGLLPKRKIPKPSPTAYLDILAKVQPEVLAKAFIHMNDEYRHSSTLPKTLKPAMAAFARASVLMFENRHGPDSPLTAFACSEAAKSLDCMDLAAGDLHLRAVRIMLRHPDYRLDGFFEFSLLKAAFEGAFCFLNAKNVEQSGELFRLTFDCARDADANNYPLDAALDHYPEWLAAAGRTEDARRMQDNFQGGYACFWSWFKEQWRNGTIYKPARKVAGAA